MTAKKPQRYFEPLPARSVQARARHCRVVILKEVKDLAYGFHHTNLGQSSPSELAHPKDISVN
jgi:hypothetical protein